MISSSTLSSSGSGLIAAADHDVVFAREYVGFARAVEVIEVGLRLHQHQVALDGYHRWVTENLPGAQAGAVDHDRLGELRDVGERAKGLCAAERHCRRRSLRRRFRKIGGSTSSV